MAERGAGDTPSERDMAQPYDGPTDGHGIAAPGRTPTGGLRAAMGFSEMIVDTVREGLLVLDFDHRVQAANESFYRMFGATREQTEGRLVYELEGGAWNLPDLRNLLERILPERHTFDGFVIEQETDGGHRQVLHLNARQLDHHEMVLLAFEDATERVQTQEELDRVMRELEQRVEARTEQVRDLARKLALAEQAERQRIAHVLHDDLQQELFGATMMLTVVTRAGAASEQARLLDGVRGSLERSTEIARSLAAELNPSVLGTDRLGDAFRWLAERKASQYGLGVEVEGDAVVADPAARALLYNVVREVLLNVSKHAGTDRARIAVEQAGSCVVVRVEDDGVGFDTSAPAGKDGGFGISSIRERLELVGGACEIASAPGEGTRVALTLPGGFVLAPAPVETAA